MSTIGNAIQGATDEPTVVIAKLFNRNNEFHFNTFLDTAGQGLEFLSALTADIKSEATMIQAFAMLATLFERKKTMAVKTMLTMTVSMSASASNYKVLLVKGMENLDDSINAEAMTYKRFSAVVALVCLNWYDKSVKHYATDALRKSLSGRLIVPMHDKFIQHASWANDKVSHVAIKAKIAFVPGSDFLASTDQAKVGLLVNDIRARNSSVMGLSGDGKNNATSAIQAYIRGNFYNKKFIIANAHVDFNTWNNDAGNQIGGVTPEHYVAAVVKDRYTGLKSVTAQKTIYGEAAAARIAGYALDTVTDLNVAF